jgi:hypothetical protein
VILISAGMPRAGTAWFFNMMNDLVVSAGFDDVRNLREHYQLHHLMVGENCRIGKPSLFQQMRLLWLHYRRHTFVFKTHSSPIRVAILLASQHTRATYIYRDPRDCAVSAFEIAQKIRQKNPHAQTTFLKIHTLDDALDAAGRWCRIYLHWQQRPSTIMIRYEDLNSRPGEIMLNLMLQLEIAVLQEQVEDTLAAYQTPARKDSPTTHFNKGITGRYKTILDDDQIRKFNREHASTLQAMGYHTY